MKKYIGSVQFGSVFSIFVRFGSVPVLEKNIRFGSVRFSIRFGSDSVPKKGKSVRFGTVSALKKNFVSVLYKFGSVRFGSLNLFTSQFITKVTTSLTFI